MPKYIRQKDHTSCGPVALINVLKWMDYNVSYDNYIHIARALCKHRAGKDGGTTDTNMAAAFRYHEISYKKVKNPTIKQIDAHLDNDGIILLDYAIPKVFNGYIEFDVGDWHYILCIGRTDKMYTVVNDATKRTVGRRRKSTFELMLKWDGNDHYAWMIKPPKK